MQFGDEFHCQNNVLIMGVFIHAVMGSDDVEIQISSVLEAKFCEPAALTRILKNPRRFFMRYEQIQNLKKDAWYIVTLVADEFCEYQIKDIEEVSDHVEEDWKRLH
ncbi:MAG: hypothetical protein FJ220_05235 [Kiritimatiellaceae bacterium]|nr:hypothetical protein [Kiritimatiellaceae bacterium]